MRTPLGPMSINRYLAVLLVLLVLVLGILLIFNFLNIRNDTDHPLDQIQDTAEASDYQGEDQDSGFNNRDEEIVDEIISLNENLLKDDSLTTDDQLTLNNDIRNTLATMDNNSLYDVIDELVDGMIATLGGQTSDDIIINDFMVQIIASTLAVEEGIPFIVIGNYDFIVMRGGKENYIQFKSYIIKPCTLGEVLFGFLQSNESNPIISSISFTPESPAQPGYREFTESVEIGDAYDSMEFHDATCHSPQ